MTDFVALSIESLQRFPAELAQLVWNLSSADVRIRPCADSWTIVEIAGHLGDAERVMRARIQQICTHDVPTIVPFDQDASVRLHHYNDADIQTLLADLHQERQTTLAFVASLSPAVYARTGWHPEVGLLRVDMMLEYLAKHDYQHYRHIHVILRHITKNGAASVREGTPIHA